MNRWEIYELLKGSKKYCIDDLDGSTEIEVIEGINEYLLSKGALKRGE